MAKAPAKKPAAAKKTAPGKAPAAAKNQTEQKTAAPVEHVDNTVKVSGHRDGSL